ncbi:alpha/beta hydrolase [Mycobacterium sp. MYCO198283]|nr:alpha/beta hydrolase [Mycobacterium sp. MYCO198283]MCG5432661.1 alpha/beta hydrolase [Mycobacterium sp. MYCO198283]
MVTGCSTVVDGDATRGAPDLDTGIVWFDCGADFLGALTPPPGARCGELGVPVDYDDADGARASVAVIKIPATGDRIGSLVINPGGPGGSGVQAAVQQQPGYPAQIRERFDVVGFDPRGVGQSRPALWCNSDADTDRQRAEPAVDYTPAGIERIDADTKAYVQRCLDKTGAEFLANVDSGTVAHDIDRLRAALGDEKLTYLGYSYGTVLGAAYAFAYPEHVRALVLDAVLDVNADPVDSDLRQAAAFQRAFDTFAADCAQRPDCPLGTDPAKAVEVYRQLVDPLVTRPAATADPRGLSYNDAISGTLQSLYTPRYWKYLDDGLRQLRGGAGDNLLAMADLTMGRDAHGHYDNSVDNRIAVRCVDLPRVTDPAVAADADRRMREVAPFLSYGRFTGHAPLGVCAFWPVPRAEPPPVVGAPTLPSTLVVSSTDDPVTPYQAGVDLAGKLRARVLTVAATAHTAVFQADACVDDAVTRYLVELQLPAEGARCR